MSAQPLSGCVLPGMAFRHCGGHRAHTGAASRPLFVRCSQRRSTRGLRLRHCHCGAAMRLTQIFSENFKNLLNFPPRRFIIAYSEMQPAAGHGIPAHPIPLCKVNRTPNTAEPGACTVTYMILYPYPLFFKSNPGILAYLACVLPFRQLMAENFRP